MVGPDANAHTQLIVEVADAGELEDSMGALRELADVFEAKRLVRLPDRPSDEEGAG